MKENERPLRFWSDDGVYYIQGLESTGLVNEVALTEDEARKIQAWLTEKLPRIEGVPF